MKNAYKIKLNPRYLLIAGMMFLLGTSYAQQPGKTATGTVVDEYGDPMVGVAVVTLESPVRGTATDAFGVFNLANVKEGETLQFQFIGMATQEVVFRGQPVDVIMHEDSFALNEVVVIAYGEQKRSAFTGSAAVVSAEEISMRPVTNVMNALEGRTSGVQIQSTSGAPGAEPSFRVRGASSLNAGKTPMMVVDGVPFQGSFNDINPNDVESVTILKDAASTAIYGARGGNGVVLITTKKGKKSDNVVVTFDAKLAVSRPRTSDEYDVIGNPGEYYERHYQALYDYFYNARGFDTYRSNKEANASMPLNSDLGGVGYVVYNVPDGQNLIGYNGRLNPNATLGRVITAADGKQYMQYPDDWVKETYKTGVRQDYSLTASGGTDKFTLFASAGYTKDDGITEAAYYERFTGRIKGTFNAKKWLRISGNVDVSVSDQNNNTDYSDNSNNVFSNASRVAPIYPVYVRDADGNILYDENGKVYDYGDGKYNWDETISRPVNKGSSRIQQALLELNKTEAIQTGAQGAVDFIIMPELTVTMNVAYEERNRKRKTSGQPFYGTSNPGGYISIYDYRNRSLNTQQLVNYSNSFGLHSVKATLLHEYYKRNRNLLYGRKDNMIDYWNMQELNDAIMTITGVSSYTRGYQTEGFGGRVMYDYNGIYHFDASYRYDGSTMFHPDYRWGHFFSFGGAYMISRERFFDVPWVDMLKVKFSYGQNGNDQINTMGPEGDYPRYEDVYGIGMTNNEFALMLQNVGTKDISWETRNAMNAGVEFELFKGRLRGGIEYYYNKTSNMLALIYSPPTIGYDSVVDNIGDMRNSGVEIDLQGDIIRNRNFKWGMYLNAAYNSSKILMLYDDNKQTPLYDGNGKILGYGYAEGSRFNAEGQEYKAWYLRKYAGVNEEGQPTWYKLDKETGELTTTTELSSATNLYAGSSQPKVLGGFGTNLSWKSLELSLAFSYRLGGYVYDSAYASLMAPPTQSSTGYNFHKDTAKSWTAENKDTDLPRFRFNDTDFTNTHDYWLTKADYLSLQNITLAYTLPHSFTDKIGASGVTVSFGVDNIFVLSHRKGLIPSRTFDGSISLGHYPEITRYMFNLSLRF